MEHHVLGEIYKRARSLVSSTTQRSREFKELELCTFLQFGDTMDRSYLFCSQSRTHL